MESTPFNESSNSLNISEAVASDEMVSRSNSASSIEGRTDGSSSNRCDTPCSLSEEDPSEHRPSHRPLPTFEQVRHNSLKCPETDEGCWLLEDEEFELTDGISDTSSVSSDEFPTPAPKITLESIARQWLKDLCFEEETEEEENKFVPTVKADVGDKVVKAEEEDSSIIVVESADNSIKPSVERITESDGESYDTSKPSINRSIDLEKPSCNGINSGVNLTYGVNTTTDLSLSSVGSQHVSPPITTCTFLPLQSDSISGSGIQLPSANNHVINEALQCGEVAVIRETCGKQGPVATSSIDRVRPPINTTQQSASTENTTEAVEAVVPAEGNTVVDNRCAKTKSRGSLLLSRKRPAVKPPSLAKPQINANHVTAAVAKKSHLSRKQDHSVTKPTATAFQPDSHLIRQSLLAKPIAIAFSKSATTTAKTSQSKAKVLSGPLKSSIALPPKKVAASNAKTALGHPLQQFKTHSTPNKAECVTNPGRRKSVAVSPIRDSPVKKVGEHKNRRRSGIPMPPTMTPMSPYNRIKDTVGLSCQSTPNRQLTAIHRPGNKPSLPKPKAQLNFSTSCDPLEGMDLEGPPPGGSKLVHSPAEKENTDVMPQSKWSPVKRNQGYSEGDECIRCTKHTARFV